LSALLASIRGCTRQDIVSCLIPAAGLLLVGSAASGQAAPDTTESRARDSVLTDSTRYVQNPHQMEAVLYALAFAPAGIAALLQPDSSPPRDGGLGYWSNHVALYAAGGLASGRDGPVLGASWTGSGSIEALRHGGFLELRVEQFRLLEHVEYRTVRVGRLFHPRAGAAGGVTLGYRSVHSLRAHEGIEVGFPFVGGGRATWMRLESAYVLSTKQSSWNYRLQAERRIGRGPLIVGCNAEFKTWEIRRHGQLSHGTFAILLGSIYTGQ
jgi:hypothetical protein